MLNQKIRFFGDFGKITEYFWGLSVRFFDRRAKKSMQETIVMAGPGQYIADMTERITRVEDLPKPKIVRRSQ